MSYVKVYYHVGKVEYKLYFKNKECKILHRENGPAYESVSGTKAWWVNGKLHRIDGPAVDHIDGTKKYFLNDIEYEEKEYWARVKLGVFV